MNKNGKEKMEKKEWYKRWWVITIYAILGLAIIGSLLLNGDTNNVKIITETKYQCVDNTFVNSPTDCLELEQKQQEVFSGPTRPGTDVEKFKETGVSAPTKPVTDVKTFKETIKEKCEKEWNNDFSMRAWCEEQELDAYDELKDIQPADIPNPIFNVIRNNCEDDWDDDFGMQVYCIENQIDGWRKIR